jgi:hypothetical protein
VLAYKDTGGDSMETLVTDFAEQTSTLSPQIEAIITNIFRTEIRRILGSVLSKLSEVFDDIDVDAMPKAKAVAPKVRLASPPKCQVDEHKSPTAEPLASPLVVSPSTVPTAPTAASPPQVKATEGKVRLKKDGTPAMRPGRKPKTS